LIARLAALRSNDAFRVGGRSLDGNGRRVVAGLRAFITCAVLELAPGALAQEVRADARLSRPLAFP
jgi:hypothetical protein